MAELYLCIAATCTQMATVLTSIASTEMMSAARDSGERLPHSLSPELADWADDKFADMDAVGGSNGTAEGGGERRAEGGGERGAEGGGKVGGDGNA